MHDLDKIRQFLRTFPGWGEQELTVDYTHGKPGSCGLFFRGMEELSRQTDVQGNALVRNRYHFMLHRIVPPEQGDGAGAAWLMDLQNWIRQQSTCGQTPRLGCIGDQEKMSACGAKLVRTDSTGCALYQLELQVDFCTYQEGCG